MKMHSRPYWLMRPSTLEQAEANAVVKAEDVTTAVAWDWPFLALAKACAMAADQVLA